MADVIAAFTALSEGGNSRQAVVAVWKIGATARQLSPCATRISPVLDAIRSAV